MRNTDFSLHIYQFTLLTMEPATFNVPIDVPIDMVDQLTAFMEELRVTGGAGPSPTVTRPRVSKADSTNDHFEVHKIANHRTNQDNGFDYYVVFNDNTEEWVSDTDCNCEQKISDYLFTVGVKTVWIVCRVSTSAQAESDKESLAAQEVAVRAYLGELTRVMNIDLQSYRIKILHVIGTAYSRIPRDIQNLLTYLNNDDMIAVWRFDRLCRNLVKYAVWLEQVAEIGVNIYSADEKLNYDDHKMQFMQSVLDGQKESDGIGKRVKLGLDARRANGSEYKGRLPYGKCYVNVAGIDGRDVKKIVDSPVEVEVINYIKANWWHGVYQVCNDLNMRSSYKRGKLWTVMMVKRVGMQNGCALAVRFECGVTKRKPTYLAMIITAISAMKERDGSSRQAIMAYIVANYSMDAKKIRPHLNRALALASRNGDLIMGGGGRNGCYMVPQM
jgi:DNA invertase Pin-like site-specific DNA recombinase